MRYTAKEIIIFVLLILACAFLIVVTGDVIKMDGLALSLSILVSLLSVLMFLLKPSANRVQIDTSTQIEETGGTSTQSTEEFEDIAELVKLDIDIAEIKKTNITQFLSDFLVEVSHKLSIVQAVCFVKGAGGIFRIQGTYAFYDDDKERTFEVGEGIAGQVVKNKEALLVDNVPDDYVFVVSGLGKGKPKRILFLPVLDGDDVLALFEFASFNDEQVDIDAFYKDLNPKLVTEINRLISD